MSKWEKLIEDILRHDRGLRFEELYKALEKIGYVAEQPRGGSSHYTFRRAGAMPITLPKKSPMNKAYIELVANAVEQFLREENNEKRS